MSLSTSCGRASTPTGRVRRSSASTASCATTVSTSSTARSRASSVSACPTCPTSCRRRGGDMTTHEKVAAVVVGAVPAGSVYADTLSRAGKKVVVLEFGPDWDNNDLISSEIWGRRIKHAPRYQLAGKNPPGHGNNAGWGTGGSMLHWFANMPRLMPNDFKVKSQYGKGLDWPISYEDLMPYFDQVAQDVGVSGDDKAESRWRPAG